MSIYLDVPYTSQLTVPFQDYTGCWLHSANMVRAYFGDSPISMPEYYAPGLSNNARWNIFAATGGTALPIGHFAIFSDASRAARTEAMREMIQLATGTVVNGPLPPGFHTNEEQFFADSAGFEPVPGAASQTFGNVELHDQLRNHGPVYFGWTKTVGRESYGHASVLIGVDNNHIWYHDPENAPNSRMSIQRFNLVVYTTRFSMMRRRNITSARVHPASPPHR